MPSGLAALKLQRGVARLLMAMAGLPRRCATLNRRGSGSARRGRGSPAGSSTTPSRACSTSETVFLAPDPKNPDVFFFFFFFFFFFRRLLDDQISGSWRVYRPPRVIFLRLRMRPVSTAAPPCSQPPRRRRGSAARRRRAARQPQRRAAMGEAGRARAEGVLRLGAPGALVLRAYAARSVRHQRPATGRNVASPALMDGIGTIEAGGQLHRLRLVQGPVLARERQPQSSGSDSQGLGSSPQHRRPTVSAVVVVDDDARSPAFSTLPQVQRIADIGDYDHIINDLLQMTASAARSSPRATRRSPRYRPATADA